MKKLSSKTWTGEVDGVTGLLVVTTALGLEATVVVVVDGGVVDCFVVTVVVSVMTGMVVALVVVDLVVDSVVGFGVEVVVSGEDGGKVVVVVDVVVVSGVVDLVVGFCVVGSCVVGSCVVPWTVVVFGIVVVVLVAVDDVTPAVVVVSQEELAEKVKKYPDGYI